MPTTSRPGSAGSSSIRAAPRFADAGVIVREISVGALPDDGEQMPSPASPHDDRTADLDLMERALDRLSLADRALLKRRDFTVLLGTPSRSPIIAEREVLEVMKRQLQVTERLL